MNMEIKPASVVAPVPGKATGLVRGQNSAISSDASAKQLSNNDIRSDNENLSAQKSTDKNAGQQSEQEVKKVVSELNSSIQSAQRNLQFSMDKDLGKIVIQVKDKQTDEVVRQIPSEEFMDLARNLQSIVDAKQSGTSAQSKIEGNSVLFSSSA